MVDGVAVNPLVYGHPHLLDPKLALSLLASTRPRVTRPPLCPCPSQELGSEEHLCKRFVGFHRADLEPLLASRLWGSGSSSLQAWARFPRWCPWPVLLTASPPALLRAGPCCRVWAGVEGARTGVWWLSSPPGRALRCLRSPIQVVPGLWFCSSDCDLSGLPVFRKDCGIGGGAGHLCPCLRLPESALYSPQGIILWFRGSEGRICRFPPQVSILRRVNS